MSVSLKPYGSEAPEHGFVGWAPVPLVVSNALGGPSGTLELTCRSAPGAISKIEFLSDRASPPQAAIDLALNPGQDDTIFIAGKFQEGERHNGASIDGKDVIIEGRWRDGDGSVAADVHLMIRTRRNANELSDTARDDFIFALAKLNGIKVDTDPTLGPGNGIYVSDFVAMHVTEASNSQHGDSHFLPWHRLYLTDLERLLQAERPTVTLPYWKFDEKAPNVFTKDFMGEVDVINRDSRVPGSELDQGGASGLTPQARFSNGNHLSRWQIRSVQGIPRATRFDPTIEGAAGMVFADGFDFPLRNQPNTMRLGGGFPPEVPQDAKFGTPSTPSGRGFERMEGSPHGAAHLSFNGRINDVPVAPQDPLFFLLHCNVDRLWAVWQNLFDREDKSDVNTYPYQTGAGPDPWTLIDATQWPWDGSISKPSPPAPAGINPPGTRKENFTESSLASNFPNNSPRLKDAIDPYGHHNKDHYLGMSYDDVPYNHAPPVSG